MDRECGVEEWSDELRGRCAMKASMSAGSFECASGHPESGDKERARCCAGPKEFVFDGLESPGALGGCQPLWGHACRLRRHVLRDGWLAVAAAVQDPCRRLRAGCRWPQRTPRREGCKLEAEEGTGL